MATIPPVETKTPKTPTAQVPLESGKVSEKDPLLDGKDTRKDTVDPTAFIREIPVEPKAEDMMAGPEGKTPKDRLGVASDQATSADGAGMTGGAEAAAADGSAGGYATGGYSGYGATGGGVVPAEDIGMAPMPEPISETGMPTEEVPATPLPTNISEIETPEQANELIRQFGEQAVASGAPSRIATPGTSSFDQYLRESMTTIDESPPTTVNTAEQYNQLRADEGVSDLETQIADLDTVTENLQAQFREQIADFRGGTALSKTAFAGRVSEAERALNERMDAVSRQRNSLARSLEIKYNNINQKMSFVQQDYSNALQAYNSRQANAKDKIGIYMQVEQRQYDRASAEEQKALDAMSMMREQAEKQATNLSNLTGDIYMPGPDGSIINTGMSTWERQKYETDKEFDYAKELRMANQDAQAKAMQFIGLYGSVAAPYAEQMMGLQEGSLTGMQTMAERAANWGMDQDMFNRNLDMMKENRANSIFGQQTIMNNIEIERGWNTFSQETMATRKMKIEAGMPAFYADSSYGVSVNQNGTGIKVDFASVMNDPRTIADGGLQCGEFVNRLGHAQGRNFGDTMQDKIANLPKNDDGSVRFTMPQVGAVGVSGTRGGNTDGPAGTGFDPNQTGHVFVVESISQDGQTMQIADANFRGDGQLDRRTYKRNGEGDWVDVNSGSSLNVAGFTAGIDILPRGGGGMPGDGSDRSIILSQIENGLATNSEYSDFRKTATSQGWGQELEEAISSPKNRQINASESQTFNVPAQLTAGQLDMVVQRRQEAGYGNRNFQSLNDDEYNQLIQFIEVGNRIDRIRQNFEELHSGIIGSGLSGGIDVGGRKLAEAASLFGYETENLQTYRALRRQVGEQFSEYLKDLSGAAVSDQEFERVKEFQLNIDLTDQDFANTLADMEEAYVGSVRAKMTRYGFESPEQMMEAINGGGGRLEALTSQILSAGDQPLIMGRQYQIDGRLTSGRELGNTMQVMLQNNGGNTYQVLRDLAADGVDPNAAMEIMNYITNN